MQKREFVPKTCRICGKEFIPTSSRNCFCSPECRQIGVDERRKRYRIKKYDVIQPPYADPPAETAKPKRRVKPAISLVEAARLAKEAHMTYGEYILKHNI